MFSIKDYIKQCCEQKDNISIRQLAIKSGQTPQNLQNKLTRDDLKVSELTRIADVLDADIDIRFLDKTTGQPIV